MLFIGHNPTNIVLVSVHMSEELFLCNALPSLDTGEPCPPISVPLYTLVYQCIATQLHSERICNHSVRTDHILTLLYEFNFEINLFFVASQS